MGEKSGTVAVDSSTSAQNGTLVGGITLGQAGLVTSDPTTAMLFDGSTGYISSPTAGLPTVASAWTMECWFKYASLSGNYESEIAMGHTVHNAHSVTDLFFDPSNNKLAIGFSSGDDLYFTSALLAGTIYHAVVTYDGSTVRTYLNGVFQTSEPVTLNLSYGSCRVGADDQNLWSSATIQEAAIYASALSAVQISNHYQIGTRVAFVGNQGCRRDDFVRGR